MANSKIFNSKNISKQIEALLSLGKVDLAVDILKSEEIRSLLPNILNTLKRKSKKQEDFQTTKIFTKTDLDKDLLKELGEILKVDTSNAKIIIDQNISAGIKLRSGDRYIDATLDTMLENAIQSITKNY
jgi:F0F1-type ATP synthase delta subunit